MRLIRAFLKELRDPKNLCANIQVALERNTEEDIMNRLNTSITKDQHRPIFSILTDKIKRH